MFAWLLASCVSLTPGPVDGPTAEASRGDLVVHVEVEGELAARRSVEVSNPVEGWSEIDFLVDDGARVQAGDLLVRMKTEEVERDLTQASAERDVALTRVEQARARLALQLGEARAAIVTARLDAELAEARQTESETVPLVERVRARIEAQRARLTTDDADLRLAKVEADALAEIEVLELQVMQAEAKMERLQARIEQSEILAPSPGVVLMGKRWGRETYRVGHEVYQGAVLLQLPDLSELDVRAWVHEVDAPSIALGQRAEVALDAVDGVVTGAEVAAVAPLVVPRGEEGVKHLEVTLRLDETTPQMKPGMTVSVDLVVAELSDVVRVPIESVFQGVDGALVRRPDGTELPVVVRAEGDELAAVEGIEAGEVVLLESLP
jgi:multidrug efflux pump subunit AcrA (membrane-fusion protein)